MSFYEFIVPAIALAFGFLAVLFARHIAKNDCQRNTQDSESDEFLVDNKSTKC